MFNCSRSLNSIQRLYLQKCVFNCIGSLNSIQRLYLQKCVFNCIGSLNSIQRLYLQKCVFNCIGSLNSIQRLYLQKCVFNCSRSSAYACVCDSGRCIHYISSHRSIMLVLSQCWWDPIAFGTICHSNNCPFIKSEAEIGLTKASVFPPLSLCIYLPRRAASLLMHMQNKDTQ